jgi:hypothetical protein
MEIEIYSLSSLYKIYYVIKKEKSKMEIKNEINMKNEEIGCFTIHFQNNTFVEDLEHALYLKDNINCDIIIEDGDVKIKCNEDELYNFVIQFVNNDEDYSKIMDQFHEHYIGDYFPKNVNYDEKEIINNINRNILHLISMEVKEKLIESMYTEDKITDFIKCKVMDKSFDINWKEDDCDSLGTIIDDYTGELIGFIRLYRFRMWIEYGDNITSEEISLIDPMITIS